MEDNYVVSEEKALAIIKGNYAEAECILENEDKFEKFLFKLEEKLKKVPIAGNKLAEIPVLIAFVKSYYYREYTDVPIGTVLAIIAALLYFLSSIDLIPDAIPGVGHIDDIAVIGFCIKMIEDDLADYNNWRKENGLLVFDFAVEAENVE